MAVKTPERREQDVSMIGEALAELGASQSTDLPPTHLAAPLPVYTLQLEDVLSSSLGAAQLTGWRYMLLSGDTAVATAELAIGAENEGRRFPQFEVGQVVEDSMRFLRYIEHHSQEYPAREYEPRFLNIPVLHVRAFWLQSDEDDVLVPLPSAHEGLSPGSPYVPQEFFMALSESAREQLNYAGRPEEEFPPETSSGTENIDDQGLSPCQLRNMLQGNAVRIPRRWDVGELSLRKVGDEWFVQVLQDRGYATERRIVAIADVVIVCVMTDSFKSLIDDPVSRLSKEDWNEWDPVRGECYSGRKEILRKLRLKRRIGGRNQSPIGAIFVKTQANVLVIAEFGLPAGRSVEWKSPLPPPESLEGGEPIC